MPSRTITLDIPLSARGNLQLSNSAQVLGYALQVGGTVEFFNSSHVGTADAPIHDIHVAGGCRIGERSLREAVRASSKDVCDDLRFDADGAREAARRPERLVLQRAAGPRHPCTTGSFPGRSTTMHDLLRRSDPVQELELRRLFRAGRRQRHHRELDQVSGGDLRGQRLLRGEQLDRLGPIIARRVSFTNSSVNHYVPIGTLMPGMPASYEEVVTITNEPGSWG